MIYTTGHFYAGTRERNPESVHVCGCLEFEAYNKSEVMEHIREEGESDAMQQAIVRAVAVLQARSLAIEFPPVLVGQKVCDGWVR